MPGSKTKIQVERRIRRNSVRRRKTKSVFFWLGGCWRHGDQTGRFPRCAGLLHVAYAAVVMDLERWWCYVSGEPRKPDFRALAVAVLYVECGRKGNGFAAAADRPDTVRESEGCRLPFDCASGDRGSPFADWCGMFSPERWREPDFWGLRYLWYIVSETGRYFTRWPKNICLVLQGPGNGIFEKKQPRQRFLCRAMPKGIGRYRAGAVMWELTFNKGYDILMS